MPPMISVVIPVYNVEKYLHRCVESILNQTFQNFEIILINDGSQDSSVEICDDYEQKDERIRVIHKKNAKVSAARNDGIKLAKGKYISFIDSDDWIEPEMYQKMANKAKKYHLDLIMCDFKKTSNYYEDKQTQPIRGGYYSKEDIRKELYPCLIMFENIEYPPTISNCVCLVNLELLRSHNLTYDEDIHYDEDSIFGSKIMYHASNFYYLKNQHYYNYYFNPRSTTNTYSNKRWSSFLKINERLTNYFGKANEFDFSRQIKINMLYLTLSELGQINNSMNDRKEKRKMIKAIMNHPKVEEIFYDFKTPNVYWKTRVIIFLIKFKMYRLYSLFLLKKHKPVTLNITNKLQENNL